MRISNTGFYHKQSNINIQVRNSTRTQTDLFMHSSPFLKSKNPNFKRLDFSFDKLITSFFESNKNQKLRKLPDDEKIDSYTAKDVLVLYLKDKKFNIENLHADSLLAQKSTYTVGKVKVLAELYLIEEQLYNEIDNTRFYNIRKNSNLLCDEEGKVHKNLYTKFINNAHSALEKHGKYRASKCIDNLKALLNATKCNEDLHPEVLDIADTSFYHDDTMQTSDIKRGKIINTNLIKLLKKIDTNTAIQKYRKADYRSIINIAWKNGDKPDENSIKTLSTILDNLDGKNYVWPYLTNFIAKVKSSPKCKNEYSLNYNEFLYTIVSGKNSIWAPYLNYIVQLTETPNGNIDAEKLGFITKVIESSNYPKDTKITHEKYLKTINTQEKLDAAIKLQQLDCVNTMNMFNQIFKICFDEKRKTIDQGWFNAIKKIHNITNNKKEIIEFLKLIKRTNTKVDTKAVREILNNANKLDDIYTALLLYKEFQNVNLKNKNASNFDKFVSDYIKIADKHYKNFYIKMSQNDTDWTYPKVENEEDIQTDYKDPRFLERYTKLINYKYKNHSSVDEIDKLVNKVGLNNFVELTEYFKDIKTQDATRFLDLLKTATENKQILRDGIEDLSDMDIYNELCDYIKYVEPALTVLGKDILKQAFSLRLEGFCDFCADFLEIIPKWNSDIKPKIFPEKTEQYQKAQINIKTLKNKLLKLVPQEQKDLGKNNKAKIEKLEKEISELKRNLKQNPDNEPQKHLITAKAKEIKTLHKEIQNYYTNKDLKNLINDINKNQAIINNLLENKLTDNAEIIKHLKCLYAIDKYFDEEDFRFYINNMSSKDKATKQRLNLFINEKIFESLDVEFNKEIKKHIDFTNSKYIAKLLEESDEDFIESLQEICEMIIQNSEKSTKEIFNNLAQNKKTKEIFKSLGINYDKWVTVNKDSYTTIEVETDTEKEKQAVIKNLQDDLCSDLWNDIPKEESKKIFMALKNNGFEIISKDVAKYDEYGYAISTKTKKILYKNNKEINFEDAKKCITILKNIMNKENYWNTNTNTNRENTPQSKEIQAKNTLLTHILKMRDKEIENAKQKKQNGISYIEVRKADMNNITHALFLGNHSHCCTAVGNGCNSWSAPEYIQNKCISAIEVVDKNEPVGNTMLYIAKVNGELSLILDNIELSSKYQYNNKIRDAIFEQAKKICKEIGKPNMKIYAGKNRHKVDMATFTLKTYEYELQGATAEQVYVDFKTEGLEFGNAHDSKGTESFYKIR